MASAADAKKLDVAKFLGGLTFNRYHVLILVISSLVTFFDGLDFALVSFTLPYLEEEMKLSEAMLGYVSAAAFAGQMVGSLIGSYIADIVGRRPVILWCTILSAVLTFITGFAETPETLIALRFLGGLSIGGLLAPAWSVNIESMPAGKRATAVTIIMLGFSVGSSAAGQVTNFVAPTYGWEGVFFVCGVLTLALAILLQFTLPESVRWMTAKGKPTAQIVSQLQRFDASIGADQYDDFYLSDERKVTDSESPLAKIKELFKGSLAYITPLIWFTYFCSSFAIYMKQAFGLLFLTRLGIERELATNLGSVGGIAGAIAGVLLLMLTEKRGPGWIAAAPLVGIPFALGIGWDLAQGSAFIPVVLIGSVLVGAGHAAVISLTSVYYPSAVRSTGGGWASFMAKFAAVAAPIVGAHYFLSDRTAVLGGYVFTAICLAGVVIGLMGLAVFAKRLHAENKAAENARANMTEDQTEVAAGAA